MKKTHGITAETSVTNAEHRPKTRENNKQDIIYNHKAGYNQHTSPILPTQTNRSRLSIRHNNRGNTTL
jgi:hypothetical protein